MLVVLEGLHREQGKSTRRVMLLSRTGSPTCWLHTGRPWLSTSSTSLPLTTVRRDRPGANRFYLLRTIIRASRVHNSRGNG